MKHGLKFLLLVAALGLQVTGHAGVTLTDAKITQIIKDVNTIDPGKSARPAVMRETVQGDQAVRTGIESRTELLFNDHSITRLGANTHFSFAEGTRNMSLQSGVMLLQVPKAIGGASIVTPAVTAGITGTTIMLDVDRKFIKFIVLDGRGCLWYNNDKGLFKHKYWASAGQEIILRVDGAGKAAPPVYVNLKLLERTSLLLTGRWGSFLDMGPILAAANSQKPGSYGAAGNLANVGAGTDVTVTQGKLPGNQPQPPPVKINPPPPPPPPTRPPGGIIP